MARKRIAALFLALALFVPVFGITAFAGTGSLDIDVVMDGAGSVTIDGVQHDDAFTISASTGQTVTMTAAGSSAEHTEFLFWVNFQTLRIVSREPTYTFTAASYTKLQAVFDLEESYSAQEDNQHTVIYLSEGDNVRFMGSIPLGDDEYIDEVPQYGLTAPGKIFKYWDHTPQQVAAESGRVFVRPVYDIDDSVFYKIRTYVNGVMQETQANFGVTAQINAPETLDGQPFSYWRAIYDDINIPSQIASFYSSYKFIVTMDATFEAVYGETVTEGIATRISGDRPDFEGASITLYAEHSVTQNYTVLQHGLIITTKESIGNFADRFVIPTGDNPDILKGTAKNTDLVGTYSVRKTKWYATNTQGGYIYPKLFVRGYVIAQDRSGVTHTVYSPIYCADYHERLFEGNDFEDPSWD